MIKQVAVNITNKFREYDIINVHQYYKSVYGLEVMLTTMLQLCGTIITSMIIGREKELIFFFVPFIVLRFSAGGYHANTAVKCFVFSVGSFLIAVCLINFFKQYNLFTYLSLIVSFLLVIKFAPQDTTNKPFKDGERNLYRRKTKKVIIVIYIFIFAMNSIDILRRYACISAIGILFESITLLPMLNNIKG